MAKKQEIDAKWLKEQAEKIKEEDIKKVVDKGEEIVKKFQKAGPLGRFIEDAKLLVSLVKDYWEGKYRKIPWWAISAIVIALIYVFNPLDLVPDVIPFVGYLDDAAVIGVCLILVEQELQEYKQWKLENPD